MKKSILSAIIIAGLTACNTVDSVGDFFKPKEETTVKDGIFIVQMDGKPLSGIHKSRSKLYDEDGNLYADGERTTIYDNGIQRSSVFKYINDGKEERMEIEQSTLDKTDGVPAIRRKSTAFYKDGQLFKIICGVSDEDLRADGIYKIALRGTVLNDYVKLKGGIEKVQCEHILEDFLSEDMLSDTEYHDGRVTAKDIKLLERNLKRDNK